MKCLLWEPPHLCGRARTSVRAERCASDVNMTRPIGITISAVVVFIGSGLIVLFGGLAALASLTISPAMRSDGPVNLVYMGVFEAVFALGLGAWGVATGVGLIQTKEWARISLIAFAALLTLEIGRAHV